MKLWNVEYGVEPDFTAINKDGPKPSKYKIGRNIIV